MPAPIEVRVAGAEDEEAVTSLLHASYPALLATGYDPKLLARALPLMVRANPALLASRTYYLALAEDGTAVGCGGWTLQRPGAPQEPVDPSLGHIRHFGVHPRWTRRGIGRALFERCTQDASATGVVSFECYATLVAERFYRSLGFETVGPILVTMGPGVEFPSLRMRCALSRRPAA